MDAVERRQVLRLILAAGAALLRTMGVGHAQSSAGGRARPAASERDVITLFVCGDVMTGRGIDQMLPHPSLPQLREPYVTSALDYVGWPNGSMARSRDAATLLTCGRRALRV